MKRVVALATLTDSLEERQGQREDGQAWTEGELGGGGAGKMLDQPPEAK